jgi:tungstate transport system substrate-binding protein
MEECIMMANQLNGYTLTDRATWLAVQPKTSMNICFEKDPFLFNPYGIIAVNPEKYPHVKYKEAMFLIDWIVSPEGQKAIADFKINGQVLFFPDSKKSK